jgi:cell division septum initiation protein DivIVA
LESVRCLEPGRKEDIVISDITFLIERLEQLLGESWRIPLSTFVVANEDELHDVIDQMRTAVPKEIRLAERIHQERERIIAQAKEEAERVVQLAEVDAAKLAEDHEIITAANQRAQTIIERAQREVETLKVDADNYARGVLESLGEQLSLLDSQVTTLQTIVRNGLVTLSQTGESSTDESG